MAGPWPPWEEGIFEQVVVRVEPERSLPPAFWPEVRGPFRPLGLARQRTHFFPGPETVSVSLTGAAEAENFFASRRLQAVPVLQWAGENRDGEAARKAQYR